MSQEHAHKDDKQMRWIADDTEQHQMAAFEWRKLNYRKPYDRALAGLLMAFAREVSICYGLPKCRPTAWGCKPRNKHMAIEIKHFKGCLAEHFRRARA
jgi:hypothetical protein